jgi:lysozyme family protein
MIYTESFRKGLAHTLGIEGPESNHPLDPGGQTVCGIARNRHPNWEGWQIIDQGGTVPNEMVALFYKVNFWDIINGDRLAALSLDVAIEVFDTAVNISPRRAGGILQEGLNLLNRNGQIYPDLLQDGKIGDITIGALKNCIKAGRLKKLAKLLNHLQAEYYIQLMRKNPEKEEFSGWFERT